jgi:hypothetical protein
MGALLDHALKHKRFARSAGAVATSVRENDILAQRRRKNCLSRLGLELFATGLNADFEAHGLRLDSKRSRERKACIIAR